MSVDDKLKNSDLSRRDALKACLAPLGVAAAGWVAGCADDGRDPYDGEPSENAFQVGSPDASSPRATDGAVPSASSGQWAVGGTKAMTGNYPDPFVAGSLGAACTLFPAMTLGPCYSRGPAAREDISDGMTGLPLRLSLLVVRSGCSPVPNAVVDIWHTGSNGVYSAFASGICNPDRLPVASQRFCRGTQTTDANGRVNFSTIFPGWYPGRSIHIHFTVRVGSQTFTSQLFFDDLLSDDILASTEYRARGKRNTTNRNDNILRGVNLEQVVLSAKKRDDNALHAWKVLSIRS